MQTILQEVHGGYDTFKLTLVDGYATVLPCGQSELLVVSTDKNVGSPRNFKPLKRLTGLPGAPISKCLSITPFDI